MLMGFVPESTLFYSVATPGEVGMPRRFTQARRDGRVALFVDEGVVIARIGKFPRAERMHPIRFPALGGTHFALTHGGNFIRVTGIRSAIFGFRQQMLGLVPSQDVMFQPQPILSQILHEHQHANGESTI